MNWKEARKALRKELPLWRRIWYDIDLFFSKIWWRIKK